MTMESPPRSSKKLLSTGTWPTSTCITSASSPARMVWVSAAGARGTPAVAGDELGSVLRTSAGFPTMDAPCLRRRRAGVKGRSARRGEHFLAEEVMHPVGLVDGVEVALSEVWGDGHRGQAGR